MFMTNQYQYWPKHHKQRLASTHFDNMPAMNEDFKRKIGKQIAYYLRVELGNEWTSLTDLHAHVVSHCSSTYDMGDFGLDDLKQYLDERTSWREGQSVFTYDC